MRIELVSDGGVVEGEVVDLDGTPVPNAVVVVGSGKTAGIIARDQTAPPVAALVRSDAQGRFRAIGVPPGEQPVQSRAVGFAPFQGQCTIVAHATGALRITLTRGATVNGVVHDASGSPVRGADVNVGSWQDFAHYRALTAADGKFTFTGLPLGAIDLQSHGRFDLQVLTIGHGVNPGKPVRIWLQIGR